MPKSTKFWRLERDISDRRLPHSSCGQRRRHECIEALILRTDQHAPYHTYHMNIEKLLRPIVLEHKENESSASGRERVVFEGAASRLAPNTASD